MFYYKQWKKICETISKSCVKTMTIVDTLDCDCLNYTICFKHDVETKPKKALKMALIENKYGICGTYYVQGYLLEKNKNIEVLKKIQSLGHEVSYHYDVMDACQGNIDMAIEEFRYYKTIFEKNGFILKTVCQHGNPLITRVGYHSNRDFFRNNMVKQLFSNIYDVMVNYKDKINCDYLYFSDAGFKWSLIFDPINNDLVNSDDKNVLFDNLQSVFNYFSKNDSFTIISTHPHRWKSGKIETILYIWFTKLVKFFAKLLYKIPFFKRIIDKNYGIAKKL